MSTRLLAALALAAVLGACSDSTGPEDFDPAATDTKAQTILSAVEGNEALFSMGVIAQYWNGFASARAALSVAPFDPLASGGPLAGRFPMFSRALPDLDVAATLALFPADVLGRTFAFDTALGRYAVDADLTGAPADGIRILLYAVDPILYEFVEPLSVVGHLDLTDVSSASADAVRIVAVVGTVTYVDYVASAVVGTTSATLSANGYVSNGTSRVDFVLSLTGSSAGLVLDYEVTTDDGSVHLVIEETDAEAAVTLTIEGDDGNVVVLTFTQTLSTLNGRITYNGEEAVVISGTPDDPRFARPGGTALTQSEINALLAIGGIVEALFDAADNLLIPAAVVFLLD